MSEPRQKGIKISIVGDANAGKSTLRRNYMGESLTGTYLPTIGADFAAYKLETDIYGQLWDIKMQIWDLAGQVQYGSMRPKFLDGTNILMIVFDLTNQASFDNIWIWLEESFQTIDASQIALVHIGNKNDLVDERVVEKADIETQLEEIMEKYQTLSVDAFETSALTGDNVEAAFITSVTSLLYPNGPKELMPETVDEPVVIETSPQPTVHSPSESEPDATPSEDQPITPESIGETTSESVSEIPAEDQKPLKVRKGRRRFLFFGKRRTV